MVHKFDFNYTDSMTCPPPPQVYEGWVVYRPATTPPDMGRFKNQETP